MEEHSNSKRRYQPSLLNLLKNLPIIILILFFISFFSILRIFVPSSYESSTDVDQAISILLTVLFGLGFCAVVIALDYLTLKNTWVEIGEEGLVIQCGIIAKKRSLLLYSDIQDVVESQGIIERIIGLKRLKIVTMSQLSAYAGNLPSFDHKTADIIKETVLRRIRFSKSYKGQHPEIEHLTHSESLELAEKMQPNIFPIQLRKGVLSALIFCFIIIFLIVVAAMFFKPEFSTLWITLGGMILISILLPFVINPTIRLLGTTYFLGKTRLEIQYKLFALEKVSIPYEKIQDIVVSIGVFERPFGIANLHVETGAVETYEKGEQPRAVMNRIPALLLDHALQLRDIIFKHVGFSTKEITPTLISKHPLEKSKPLKKTLKSTCYLAIAYLVICIICLIMAPQWFMQALLYGFLILIFLTIATYIHEIYYLRSYYYNFTEDCLLICKGVFNVKEITIPFERIQNVFVDQDIFDRIFGLWDVHVSTVAPQSIIEGHIDGLNEQNAKALKEMLLSRIKKK
ncbi:MAG: PH domain-containing protein [Candidatus Diapherotrites archaeon]